MNKFPLVQIIDTLNSMFTCFNTKFYDGKLDQPVITVSPDQRKLALGWCTCWKAWKEDGTDGYYEINMCAEHLNRPFLDICETLLHEMVHLFNLQEGVKDCSRGNTYHNKRFKEAAEAHGLNCERHEKYGWTITTLTEATAEWLKKAYGNAPNAFTIFRDSKVKSTTPGKKNSKSRKYVCPECCAIIRATKEVRVICADCGVEFKEEGGDNNV